MAFRRGGWWHVAACYQPTVYPGAAGHIFHARYLVLGLISYICEVCGSCVVLLCPLAAWFGGLGRACTAALAWHWSVSGKENDCHYIFTAVKSTS